MTESQSDFFARRTNWNCTTNAIISSWKSNANHVLSPINLSESNPTRCKFRFFKQFSLQPLSANEVLQYQPSTQGLKIAREAVVDYYQQKGFDVDLNRIYLTASTSEAYTFLFRLHRDILYLILFVILMTRVCCGIN